MRTGTLCRLVILFSLAMTLGACASLNDHDTRQRQEMCITGKITNSIGQVTGYIEEPCQ